ncbi:MAG: glycoside hydrolase family 5 protein [Huintestinicola sp.]|uniref:glycoside hydrolase family 5 protein n=1 Tax=Huintestinicola sp. TaxID=2981661 RepID=UPI003F0640F6
MKAKNILKGLLRTAALLCAALMLTASAGFSVSAQKYTADDFVHAEGRRIIGTDGKELHIKGMALGNSVWSDPQSPDMTHHNEKTYKELSEMGFNCVRFYINYGLFESDNAPYHYKKSGFKWLDKNIAWAKKYGMGIIINMHCPQGGYQSNGDGLELWNSKQAQDRLAALWKRIAKRYADEPTVWGYGLINEPVVPMRETMEETYGQFNSLMQRLASEIRSVSPYQAVFAEGVGAAVKTSGEREYEYFTPEHSFADIDDDNVVYEFHKYDPFFFTHQNTGWAGTEGITMTYPSEEIVGEKVINGWVKCLPASKRSVGPNGWAYFESRTVSLTSKANVVTPVVTASSLGDGAVYFDDITLTEISPDGKRRTLFSADFSDGAVNGSSWSEDGSGISEYCADEGNKAAGCLKISGTASFYVHNFKRYEMKKGYKYMVSGYIKCDSGSPEIRMDMSLSGNIQSFDKAYLESCVLPYVRFSKKHDVPIYLGEFGVISEGLENGRNGMGWVRDMISICQKYNIGFNYHVYNEPAFGLYDDYPKGRNEELAELFREMLKKQQ